MAEDDTREPRAGAPAVPADHPLRRPLSDEVHARPFAQLRAPERASHLAVLSGEGGAAADRAHLTALCARYALATPADDDNHVMADFGPFRLKWERHTEFCSYTVFVHGPLPAGDPFAEPAIAALPADWVEAIPGKLLAAVHVALEPSDAPERGPEEVGALMGSANFAGAGVAGGAATAWMDFTVGADGFGRCLVRDHHLHPRQAGRLVQRLLEIETYRMVALLALPLARAHGAALTRLGERLRAVTGRMTTIRELDEERQLLEEIARLSAEVEDAAAETGYRFSAARAYSALVERRIAELREERLSGYQTFGEFMERRLAPAMRTCEAVDERLASLSRRLTRAGQLLRTRVEIQVEAQNRDLLASMDRRARLQLLLQETVEGLSVAAITYYVVGLVAYAAEALAAAGAPVPVEIATGLAIPVVAGLVWFGVRKVRRLIAKRAGGPAGG